MCQVPSAALRRTFRRAIGRSEKCSTYPRPRTKSTRSSTVVRSIARRLLIAPLRTPAYEKWTALRRAATYLDRLLLCCARALRPGVHLDSTLWRARWPRPASVKPRSPAARLLCAPRSHPYHGVRRKVGLCSRSSPESLPGSLSSLPQHILFPISGTSS